MADFLVGETLHHLLHAYKRTLRRAYANAGIELNVSHIRALKTIRGAPSCTPQFVAQRLKRDKSQITRLLRELIETQSVDKRSDPVDRRSQRLELTATGKDIMARIDACEHQVHRQLAAGFDQADLATFEHLARLMMTNLD